MSEPARAAGALTLKLGSLFALLDAAGNIQQETEGMWLAGTRHLSCLVLHLDGQPLQTLATRIDARGNTLLLHGCNPATATCPAGAVHLRRQLHLQPAGCTDRYTLTSYAATPLALTLSIDFAANFSDIFETRGMQRARHGQRHRPVTASDNVCLAYTGCDGGRRETHLTFSPAPGILASGEACYHLSLQPGQPLNIQLSVAFIPAPSPATRARSGRRCRIEVDDPILGAWLDRSALDLDLLSTPTRHGPYPDAGVPWFATPFGRDGIITALLCLWAQPEMARAVLAFLADTQATRLDPARDAEPGKILHEARQGEMAACGEIPFDRYYGSVDATPLFVVLAGAWWQRMGDQRFLQKIWPHVIAALDWMDQYGDADQDGFVEYGRQSGDGLINQCWKDSADSVFHADGRLAHGPIAMCEVQSYVFAAWRHGAQLARIMGDPVRARRWAQQAQTLKYRFDAAFWSEPLGTYALALDGNKYPCLVRSSNAGHTLFSGIAPPHHARQVAASLFSPDLFSGWGIRTIAVGEARYNPLSYHNGSIWPHDNALIALGLARYGLKRPLRHLLRAMVDAAGQMPGTRVPELFCGFPRTNGEPLVPYPSACSPQAWAAASVYGLLGAALGIRIDAAGTRLRLIRPVLPEGVQQLVLRGLPMAGGRLDVCLEKSAGKIHLRRS